MFVLTDMVDLRGCDVGSYLLLLPMQRKMQSFEERDLQM